MQVAQLLFTELTPDGKPLFSYPAALAAFLREHRLSSQPLNSLSSFLGQIIVRRERRCPDQLQEILIRAIDLRLQDQPAAVREVWTNNLRQALRITSKRSGSRNPFDTDTLLFTFERALANAREVCAIVQRPMERSPCPYATRLQTILMGHFEEDQGERPFRYALHLPSQELCMEWWEIALFWMLEDAKKRGQVLDRRDVEQRFTTLEERDRLCLYTVPAHLCGVPTIVLNPRETDIQLFNVFLHTDKVNAVPTIATADPLSLEHWRSNVFIPLEIGRIHRTRVRCRM